MLPLSLLLHSFSRVRHETRERDEELARGAQAKRKAHVTVEWRCCIEVEEDWNCCFQPEEVDQIRVLKELEIDTRLCSAITIAKTCDGRFFALWSERHPEMVPIEELHGCSPGWIFRQFIKLEKRMPSEHFAEEISRRDAYSIIAFLWLPKEFHPEAGV